MNTSTATRVATPWWAGALAGVLAAGAGVMVGRAASDLLTGVPSPIESVGNRAIDLAPPFLKDFAIAQFGTNDKPILIGGVVVTLAIIAAVAGIIGRKHRNVAIGMVAVLGLVAVLTAVLDRTSTANLAVTAIPTALTLVVSLGALIYFLNFFALGKKDGDELPSGFNRRGFFKAAAGAGVLVIAGGVISKLYGGAAAAASRAGIKLPTLSKPADAVPAGAQADVEGISPFVTSNKDFYRVDTALSVPDVPAEGWKLRIHGMVDKELNLSYRDIMEMPLVERRITLTCVSNEVGGPYVDNAAWIGVPVRDLLAMAGVQAGADAIKSTSADSWTAGTPLPAVTDDRNSLLAIGMNGEPLPLIHGFPARLVVPGHYGYVSATKWLTDIEVTRFADFKAYWTTRDYDAEAPIKMSSRIDVPKSFQAFAADKVRVGGVAWAQTSGINKVEVKIDDGAWQLADLATEDNIETWRQWTWTWDQATSGNHSLTVRATNNDGETQTSDRARIRPNGTTGWHSVQFRVE